MDNLNAASELATSFTKVFFWHLISKLPSGIDGLVLRIENKQQELGQNHLTEVDIRHQIRAFINDAPLSQSNMESFVRFLDLLAQTAGMTYNKAYEDYVKSLRILNKNHAFIQAYSLLIETNAAPADANTETPLVARIQSNEEARQKWMTEIRGHNKLLAMTRCGQHPNIPASRRAIFYLERIVALCTKMMDGGWVNIEDVPPEQYRAVFSPSRKWPETSAKATEFFLTKYQTPKAEPAKPPAASIKAFQRNP